MIVLDKLLVKGLAFVFDKIAQAADAEGDDVEAMREELLRAELRRERGEISDEEHAEVEREVLARLRAAEARRRGEEWAAGGTVVEGAGGVEVELLAPVEESPAPRAKRVIDVRPAKRRPAKPRRARGRGGKR